jgi:putative ABC transport system permease protein
MKIPLAWHQLTHEKMRLLVALAGITFADVLMFLQLGFRDALFNSSIRLHQNLRGDIFLINSQTDTLTGAKSFSSRRLYEVMGVKDVQSVSPIYIDFALWKNPDNNKTRRIFVIGFNPANPILYLPGLQQNIETIKQQDVVLFDRKSRKEFGSIVENFERGKTISTEVSNRRLTLGGLFILGASFGADGNLITSDVNFLRIFSKRNKGLIDVGMIQLKPGADLDSTLKNIRDKLAGGDVKVFSKKEFLDHEQHYWKTRTAIGFIFALGTTMGFIVGIVIVYQILYTDVADHLPEYATLKAMGYTDLYLLTVVFQEAIILGCIGFFPGFSLSIFLYLNTARATGLPIMMTVARAINILILTVLMCCISGAIAVGKIRAADPADIF